MDDFEYLCTMCSNLTLLYVEDDDIVRMTTMSVLEEIFGEIIVACNGQEALELFNDNTINIIITDVFMPNLNGIELVKEIRKNDTDVKILVFSGYYQKDFKNDFPENSVNGFLLKPINIEQVVKELTKVIKV